MQSWILEQAWVVGIGAAVLAGAPPLARRPGVREETDGDVRGEAAPRDGGDGARPTTARER